MRYLPVVLDFPGSVGSLVLVIPRTTVIRSTPPSRKSAGALRLSSASASAAGEMPC